MAPEHTDGQSTLNNLRHIQMQNVNILYKYYFILFLLFRVFCLSAAYESIIYSKPSQLTTYESSMKIIYNLLN